MNNINVTDEWLEEYMPIIDIAIIEKLENEVNHQYKFSRKFRKKMKKLLWNQKYPWLKTLEVYSKRVAILFITIIITALIFTLSVEAHREKFFNTIKTFFEDSVLYSYFLSDNEEENEKTEPSYIPRGYIESERIENDLSLIIIYQNEYGNEIVWEQRKVENESCVLLDNEFDVQENRVINNKDVTIYSYTDGYLMAYYESNRYIYLITADNISHEELYKMIDGMN